MIDLLQKVIFGIYNAFNVVIPGFNISISNIVLGCVVVSAIICLVKLESSRNVFTRGGKK